MNERTRPDADALTGSGEFRKGAQVIQTPGLPDGYTPPSASLTPPAPPPPTPQPQSTTGDAAER
jgi:hypothetical protein